MSFDSLPIELLYEVQLYALSPALPQVSRYIHNVFKSSPVSFRADYILGNLTEEREKLYNRAIRFPICSHTVLDLIHLRFVDIVHAKIDLPRWPFRLLAPLASNEKWAETSAPLPYIQRLYSRSSPTLEIDVNSHQGYALTKAVHANFTPCIKFLLAKGANPGCKDCLAVTVAIRQKNLPLVKLLVERTANVSSQEKTSKRRRLEDRVNVNGDMLKTAVRCGAHEIVDYFIQVKGCIPDMQTLQLMMRSI